MWESSWKLETRLQTTEHLAPGQVSRASNIDNNCYQSEITDCAGYFASEVVEVAGLFFLFMYSLKWEPCVSICQPLSTALCVCVYMCLWFSMLYIWQWYCMAQGCSYFSGVLLLPFTEIVRLFNFFMVGFIEKMHIFIVTHSAHKVNAPDLQTKWPIVVQVSFSRVDISD